MKQVLVKWCRTNHDDKCERHARIRNAYRTIRQQTRKQLRDLTIDLSNYSTYS